MRERRTESDWTGKVRTMPGIVLLVLCVMCGSTEIVLAQRADLADPRSRLIGQELLKKVVTARGGAAYTGIRTIIASGQFTPFDKGLSGNPSIFTNYVAYPDRERVEFGKGKKKDRRIQVNTGRSGWVYDGDAQTIKDQTAKQIEDYLEAFDFDLDRILRDSRSWGSDDAGLRIRFYGREELRPGERADVVLIEPGPGRQILIWIDRKTSLPISVTYEKSGAAGLSRQEIRFHQYIDYDGVVFPNIVDYYRDGVQESRVNYQSIRLNTVVSDGLFVRPVTIKDVK